MPPHIIKTNNSNNNNNNNNNNNSNYNDKKKKRKRKLSFVGSGNLPKEYELTSIEGCGASDR